MYISISQGTSFTFYFPSHNYDMGLFGFFLPVLFPLWKQVYIFSDDKK